MHLLMALFGFRSVSLFVSRGNSCGGLSHVENDVAQISADLAVLPTVGPRRRLPTTGEHASVHVEQLLSRAVLARLARFFQSLDC